MPVKFFGQFLLERGKIIREELLDALKFQKEVNVKLGIIALDAGYLTKEQVENIHLQQHQNDAMFGKIAVDLKYLTEKELEELLLIQKNERITLGEALVQKGYLTLSELAQELQEYKRSQEGVSEKVYQIVKNSVSPVVPETFIDVTLKLFRRVADLDFQCMDVHNNVDRISPHLWNVYQSFGGDSEGLLMLSLPESVFLQIASHIAQEKIWEIDEFAKDGVKEFVNFIAGNSVAKLSQQKIKLGLYPPQFLVSLGNIKIPEKSSETISIFLASPEHEAQNYNLQVSLVYSPILPS